MREAVKLAWLAQRSPEATDRYQKAGRTVASVVTEAGVFTSVLWTWRGLTNL